MPLENRQDNYKNQKYFIEFHKAKDDKIFYKIREYIENEMREKEMELNLEYLNFSTEVLK